MRCVVFVLRQPCSLAAETPDRVATGRRRAERRLSAERREFPRTVADTVPAVAVCVETDAEL